MIPSSITCFHLTSLLLKAPSPVPTPVPTPEPTTSAPTTTPAPTVTCPPVNGFTAVKENDDQCYYISDDAMTWNDCETSCASDLTSATMLCIEDSTQEDLLVANFGTTTSTGVWIGLQADQTSDLTGGTGWYIFLYALVLVSSCAF